VPHLRHQSDRRAREIQNDAIVASKLSINTICVTYGFFKYDNYDILSPYFFFPFINPYFFSSLNCVFKMSQLPVDCLNEIFEYLENEKSTLRSCLLDNHLWCEIAVRILWRNVWNYCFLNFRITLIACLPNKSKEILCMGGINISAPTSKPLMFNYAKFCKVLSIN